MPAVDHLIGDSVCINQLKCIIQDANLGSMEMCPLDPARRCRSSWPQRLHGNVEVVDSVEQRFDELHIVMLEYACAQLHLITGLKSLA